MLRNTIIIISIICGTTANAQFKNDNLKYTNVFPEDLCKALQANPGYTLLDVRSKGEFEDTLASSPGLNIGHIKGALHISISELPQRWKELSQYKDKPLFIYCSHSQRSRRASRMLADSGFTKLFNVDGGLTDFYVQGITQNPCNSYAVVSSLPYKIVSPKQLDEGGKKNKYFILDIRNDSAFKGIASSESLNAMGRFNDAINVPFSKLSESIATIPSDKAILIVDSYGAESPKAALSLIENGINDVSILINGMDEWLDYSTEVKNRTAIKWISAINYKIIPAEEFYTAVESKKDYSIIDTRTKEEFTNQSKNYWENIGQIKTAVNIPADDIISGSQLSLSKSTPVILYGFNNQEKVYKAAAELKKAGYEKVSVLRSGIWNLRWSSHNIKGKKQLNSLVINVPEENL